MNQLQVFGSVELSDSDGRSIRAALAQPKRLALLVYLAVARPRGFHRRDKLLSFFWPELDDERARAALSTSLTFLRKTVDQRLILARGSEEVGLNDALFTTDVWSFEAALGRDDSAAAIGHYRGPFLDGFHPRASNEFEDWRDAEARRLDQQAEKALEELAREAEGSGLLQTAAAYWERLAANDPFNSRFVMGWMRALGLAGDPGNAIQFGKDHLQLLEEELGAEPPADVLVLLEQLKRGEIRAETAQASMGPAKKELGFPFEMGGTNPGRDKGFTFVGRELEMGRLGSFLDQALEGEGCVAFVTGEAGAGKTALAREFGARAGDAHPDLIIANGNGNAHVGVGDPYLPFREILALLTGDVESRVTVGSISRAHSERLWNLIPESVAALQELAPDLIDAFLNRARLLARVSAFSESNPGKAVGLDTLKREARSPQDVPVQSALFLQLVRTLRAVARVKPLFLVLDDLQWADSGSLGLLFQLGRQLSGSRILVLGCFRPSDVALGRDGGRHPLEGVVNEFRRSFGEIEIPLGENGDRGLVEALIDATPNELGPEFRDTLFEQTEGHALFTAELLGNMRDEGMLVPDEDGRWVEGEELRWDVLPDRVDAVIGERLSRLPSDLYRILRTASLEGEEFTLECIAQVLGVDADDLLEPVSQELEKRHRLVWAQGFRRVDGQPLSVYRFRHILFQRYLYDRLDDVERALLHERVARALEALHGEHSGEVALTLARHFRLAGLPAKAAQYFFSAGKQALKTAGYSEAIAHLESSLTLLHTLPPSGKRDVQELEAQLALGNSLHLALDPRQGEAFQRACELAEELDDDRSLGWALRGIYVVTHYAGNHRIAAQLAERVVAIARKVDDRSLLSYGLDSSGRSAVMRGEYLEALSHYDEFLSTHIPGQHFDPVHLGGIEAGSIARGTVALAKLPLGYPAQAAKWSREAKALARERRAKVALTYILLYDSIIRVQTRDAEGGLSSVREWRGASEEVGMTAFWGPYADLCEGWCRAQVGDVEAGIRLTSGGLKNLKEMGVGILIPFWAGWTAEALALGGRSEEGLALLDEARAESAAIEELEMESDILRIRGDLLLAQPHPHNTEAEVAFRAAIEVAREQQTKWFELRATTALASLLHSDESRTMLRVVYDWFSEGFDTPDLKDAAAVLAEMEGT